MKRVRFRFCSRPFSCEYFWARRKNRNCTILGLGRLFRPKTSPITGPRALSHPLIPTTLLFLCRALPCPNKLLHLSSIHCYFWPISYNNWKSELGQILFRESFERVERRFWRKFEEESHVERSNNASVYSFTDHHDYHFPTGPICYGHCVKF